MISVNNNNQLVITLNEGTGYYDARLYIKSLLNLLQGIELDMVGKEDIYFACSLIEHLLPPEDEFNELEKLKTAG